MGAWADLAEALQEMGYDRKRISDVLNRLEKEHADTIQTMTRHQAEELLFRQAIIALG